MDINRRQVGEHVEWESDSWRSAFFLDMRMLDIFTPLAADIKRLIEKTPLTSEEEVIDSGSVSGQSLDRPVSWSRIHQLLRQQVNHILELTQMDGIEWQIRPFRTVFGTFVRSIAVFVHLR